MDQTELYAVDVSNVAPKCIAALEALEPLFPPGCLLSLIIRRPGGTPEDDKLFVLTIDQLDDLIRALQAGRGVRQATFPTARHMGFWN